MDKRVGNGPGQRTAAEADGPDVPATPVESIALPAALSAFAEAAALDWPRIDLGAVRELAAAVRDFARDSQATNDEATAVIEHVVAVCGGAEAGQRLLDDWTETSVEQVERLVFHCAVVAQTLDAAVAFIADRGREAVAEVAVLAAEYHELTGPDAASPDPGSPAAARLFAAGRTAAEEFGAAALRFLETYVIGKAVVMLEEAVDEMVNRPGLSRGGMDGLFQRAGVPGDSDRNRVAEVERCADVLDGLADQILEHAAAFAARAGALTF